MEQLKDMDGIIETSSNVSTPFQTSNENISVKKNEKNALKLQTNLDALDSYDSEVSSLSENECLLKNKKLEGIQKRKRQSLDLSSSSSS